MVQVPTDTSLQQLIPFTVSVVLALSCLVQLIYYWLIYSRLAFYRNKKPLFTGTPPVSVIICAKDEYHNLLEKLPVVLEQDYPNYEVVVVNDASEDDSLDLLQSIAKKYKHLKVFNLEQDLNFFRGKKFPLALGIKASTHDILLMTDADCKPAGKDWIRRMMRNYQKGTEVVLGYGPFFRKKTFLNRLIRYDSLQAAVNYFSFALAGMPYMGVGRNLSYRKELFYRTKGFTSHYRLQSGDDDLFINYVARKDNTRVEISPESFNFSEAKVSFNTWLWQKKRHYTTSTMYRKRFKFLLSLQYITKVLIYASLIALIIINYNFIPALMAFGLYYVSHLIIWAYTARRLGERDLVLISPVMELLLMLIVPVIYLSNLLRRPDRWQ